MTDPVLIDVPVPIYTPRLMLRPPRAGDGAPLARASDQTWDDLSRWMPWAVDYAANTDPDKREIFVRREAARFILRENLMLIGFDRHAPQDPLVFTGFSNPDWTARSFTVGYWVPKEAQGRGYAAEAANALIRYAFAVLGANRVDISHAEGNDYSRRVIEGLGIPYEARLVQNHCLPDGCVVDDHIYALTSPEGLVPLEISWAIKEQGG